MKFCGLDEAALGPRLGPFCVALVEFVGEYNLSQDSNLYEILHACVSSNINTTERIPISDSKKIYKPACGISKLEHSVAIFLSILGIHFPSNLHHLVKQFCPLEDFQRMQEIPWFRDFPPITLPLSNIPDTEIKQKASFLLNGIQSVGLKMLSPQMRFITAKTFNSLLGFYRGKSGAVRSVINSLLIQVINPLQVQRVSIDRQGGRKYYADWLVDLIPGATLQIVEENPQTSSYNIGNSHIEFLVSADRIRMETALASMFAKYLRELAMKEFNRWWSHHIKDLRPTAGYPRDAQRFIKNIENAQLMPRSIDTLIRRL